MDGHLLVESGQVGLDDLKASNPNDNWALRHGKADVPAFKMCLQALLHFVCDLAEKPTKAYHKL